MHAAINEIGKDVHTVRACVFDYELLITRDIDNIKAIFNTQSADFDIGPHREKTFKSAFGLGVMTARGEAWQHSRRLIRPQFTRDNTANLPMFEKHVQSLFKKLRPTQDLWTSKVDLQPLFSYCTLDISTEFLVSGQYILPGTPSDFHKYGQSVWSQDVDARSRLPLSRDPEAPDVANFGAHLDEVKHILDRQGALAKYSWLVNSDGYSEHCKGLRSFVDYFVRKALEQTNEEKRSSDMQDKYVLLDELAKHSRNPAELRNETLNVLHASRDTTAALMGWIVYFLARHEDVFQTLRAEILNTFTSNGTPIEITFKGIHSMTFMPQVINETIRMVGIVPMNERAALQDTTLPRGGGPDGLSPVFVPKGRQILIPTYSMQHREDIWGPDVDLFKPSRWTGRRADWDFIPFGSGARQCLGQQFARTQVMYVIIRLLQTFDAIENVEAPGPMRFHHTIENRSGNGVQVRLHAALPTTFHALRQGVSAEE
ncbi:hypothetical protein LTR51_001625 [Lithohypha guttulata]|uniref:Cytochrome P450 n=1 Tax=Lithohypha guttulata TaxID=1690604 RepID=A0AAN7STI8_9EURO|nr:hypothetical protein LTR51_001625 [Lithohypha guttulata]KAK5081041.1 hypothetical protein LTR05_008358 [Lithohypha guttulata]